MPIYKGIDASVIIDGTKAQEYNKSTNYFTSTVTTYIVAEEGSTYTLDFDISKRDMGAERHHIHIIVDSETVLEQTSLSDKYNVNSVFFRDPKKSDCVRRAKLVFAGPAGLRTDGKSDQKATAQKLGTIEVRLRRGETEITENIFAGCPFIPGSTEGNGSYQTEYDLQETVPDLPPYVKTISIDTRRPWVTFKFKYGSRELIRAKHPFRGLVPCIQGSPRSRDPSDQATESEINAKLPEYELPPEYEEMVAEEDR
ncbi:hypothetical protein TWF106_008783 [Orbilia oligospora]|uniref:DUF7918 domain-containing protein n=1 Tax=Orbilia oligospora TaxID=2813651 RepID=A0A6G1M5G4_ORBOL|nr:hypothetical protein TWF106_008783 [Orbilia oligospora]KAF3227816.1 hypothetical protein TWF191_003338 [Orbilia oligospora]KAF3244734.1 hypothetical protein TWF192_007668 [Orbilia oligospora]